MKFLKLLKSMLSYMTEDKTKMIIAIVLIILASLVQLTYGYLNGAAVEAITKINVKWFLIYLSLYFAIQFLGNNLLRRKSRVLLNKIELNLAKSIGNNVFEKMGKLPAVVFEEKTSGEMINRITTDPETITSLISQLLNMFIDIFGSFLVIFYIFYNSWIVGLEIVVYILIIILITKRYAPKIKKAHKEIKADTDDYVADVNQCIIGIREIKGLGIRENINRNIFTSIGNIVKKRENLMNFETNYTILVRTLNSLLEVGVFVTCGLLIYNGISTLTFFIAMTYYVYRYMGIAESFSSFAASYQRVVVAMERINELLDNNKYKEEEYGNIALDKIKGNITFKDVKFGYEENNTLLNNFNVTFNTGKKIAIVGKSGQGKSTIFNLLLRYFEPNEGEILIDDIPLKGLTEKSLRDHISIIRQDPFIFNKTLKENFQILNPELSLRYIRKYCKMAEIDDYIMSLPDKYDTKIGESGVNLSGGQKQRIAIARSLMKKSRIVLFDEATSALDNQSQACINRAIKKIAKSHTVIIIAHRLSTIMDADEIYVIDKGKVMDNGTHDYLMCNCDLYRELYMIENI